MREIKFRAWNKELKLMAYDVQNEYDTITGVRYWKYGKELDLEPGESSFGDYLSQTKYDVMQFTGLLDKNGKEIYESDIIKYHYFYFADGSEIEKEHVCSVKYDDSFANFDAMDKEGFAHFLGNASDDGIEVIGNIYEHPELLK